MKKLILCFSLFVIGIIIFLGDSTNNKSSMQGRYLEAVNGSHIIIDKDNTPITMGNKTGKEDVFDNLKNGDIIEITYDSIAEIYPAMTQIYNCKLIKRGRIEDVPKTTLKSLEELGYDFDL